MSATHLSIRSARLIALLVVFVTGGCLSASAHPATGIVVDRQGQVYFSDLETIWKLDTQGKLSVFRAGVRGRHVHELSIDANDNVYGADVSYEPSTNKWISSVWKITSAGKFSWIQEPTSSPPPGLSIWMDQAGNLYSVDQNNHTKTQTLLIRRTPQGAVSTFAGSAYGHADGQGAAAQFSSVGGMAFGPDGSIYLSDGNSVRKVSPDANVTTVASGLDFVTREDRTRLFTGSSGSLSGLAVDAGGTVYVADGGKRRLLKIGKEGKVEVVYRAEPPFFPNGVFAARNGDVFVLEVGFTVPNQSSGPRIRKLAPDGGNQIIAIVGERTLLASLAQAAGTTAESTLDFFSERLYYVISFALIAVAFFVWRRRKKQRYA